MKQTLLSHEISRYFIWRNVKNDNGTHDLSSSDCHCTIQFKDGILTFASCNGTTGTHAIKKILQKRTINVAYKEGLYTNEVNVTTPLEEVFYSISEELDVECLPKIKEDTRISKSAFIGRFLKLIPIGHKQIINCLPKEKGTDVTFSQLLQQVPFSPEKLSIILGRMAMSGIINIPLTADIGFSDFIPYNKSGGALVSTNPFMQSKTEQNPIMKFIDNKKNIEEIIDLSGFDREFVLDLIRSGISSNKIEIRNINEREFI